MMKIEPFEFNYKPHKGETCFSFLPKMVEEIDTAANKFLEQFDFVPSDKIADDIWSRAVKLINELEDNAPDWVIEVIDGGVPYCPTERLGSLYRTIALSCSSRDAHLRCFWENIKNDTDYKLPFPVLAPMMKT
jgi:hypothetical protein